LILILNPDRKPDTTPLFRTGSGKLASAPPKEVNSAQDIHRHSDWWKAPLAFMVESLTGLTIFTTIAVAAVLLNFGIDYLATKKVSKVILLGLTAAEYMLFAVDLILFARFLWRTLIKNWKEL
jgi:hypothetical protein